MKLLYHYSEISSRWIFLNLVKRTIFQIGHDHSQNLTISWGISQVDSFCYLLPGLPISRNSSWPPPQCIFHVYARDLFLKYRSEINFYYYPIKDELLVWNGKSLTFTSWKDLFVLPSICCFSIYLCLTKFLLLHFFFLPHYYWFF